VDAPDVFPDLPGEARSDCAQCPLAGEHATGPWPWRVLDDIRCCTYHPTLFNFRAGSALARGGAGADRVLARITAQDGVSMLGIGPSSDWVERYDRGAAFGRDAALRCPYSVGGEHACGIWHDRPSVCRAWFCRHDRGLDAAAAWSRLGDAAGDAEESLARRLCANGAPPAPDTTDAATWVDWFRWCADHAAALAEPAPEVAAARDTLVQIRARTPTPLPDILVPSVSAMWRPTDPADARVLLAGYSTFDAAHVTPAVFDFLSRLDGKTPWRDALTADITEDTVRELLRTGALALRE